jgi:hypothetical protein
MSALLVAMLSYWSANSTENDRIGAFRRCECLICKWVVVRIY